MSRRGALPAAAALRIAVAAVAALAATQAATQATTATAAAPTPLQRVEIAAMHTTFELHLPATATALVPALRADLEAVEAVANEWRPGSPLAQINAAAGGAAVTVPAALITLLELARSVAQRSGGAFDPTWAALWGLWRFDGSAAAPPDAATLAARRRLVGYRDLHIDRKRRQVRLARAGMAVGLGGIAKGYALDLLARRLDQAGVASYALSAGGQVLVRGERAPGRRWSVGVRAPRGAGPDDTVTTLWLRDVSVSTSGDYERFFVHDGVRYHHLLDPRTGAPARGLQSATVVHRSAALADAYSTAVFVLGPVGGAALCRVLARREAAGCVLVDDDGRGVRY